MRRRRSSAGASTRPEAMSIIRQTPMDQVQPFQIERGGTRGRLVRLGPLIDTVLAQHDYPEPVALLLAEMLSLAAALPSSTNRAHRAIVAGLAQNAIVIPDVKSS